MKIIRLYGAVIVVVVALLLAGCGDDHRMGGGPPPPPPPRPSMTKDLDMAAVLAIVQMQTSETADPFQVDNAAMAVTPIGDETSSPLSVDAT